MSPRGLANPGLLTQTAKTTPAHSGRAVLPVGCAGSLVVHGPMGYRWFCPTILPDLRSPPNATEAAVRPAWEGRDVIPAQLLGPAVVQRVVERVGWRRAAGHGRRASGRVVAMEATGSDGGTAPLVAPQSVRPPMHAGESCALANALSRAVGCRTDACPFASARELASATGAAALLVAMPATREDLRCFSCIALASQPGLRCTVRST